VIRFSEGQKGAIRQLSSSSSANWGSVWPTANW